jgi:Na+:H+ antiporter, NhaA family
MLQKVQESRLSKLFIEFFQNEKAGGLVLIGCTILSLLLANSSLGADYHHFWSINFNGESYEHWINDGLMTLFFLLVGLELEREIYVGELSNLKEAALPIFGAIGGMIVPALMFFALNFGLSTQSGAGVPMATDIAFALGVLSLLGNRVPVSMKIFLTALAVIDDLGAIVVIAIFYPKNLDLMYLAFSLGVFGVLLLLNKLKVKQLFLYLIGGIAMWYFMLHSGVHATITGVLLAFAIPFGNGEESSISYKLQHYLHKPVVFIILPLFALANTAITIRGDFSKTIFENYSLGIALGLVVGKPIGIFLFSLLSAKTGLSKLPNDLTWKKLFSVGILGGIGFTMSIFMTLLSFDNELIIDNAKLVILLSSLTAAIIGLIVLKINLKQIPQNEDL